MSGKDTLEVGRASLPANNNLENLEPIFSRYQRNLPHWRLSGAVYFLTWRLHASQPELNQQERELVQNAIEHHVKVRYELFAWVVMNDHVHVLIKPGDDQVLEAILHSWKSFTAHQFQRLHGRSGRVWVEETFDRIIRDEGEFWQKFQYIADNPRRRWPELESYPWLGLRCPE